MLHFLGTNSEHIAGAGMGNMFCNVTGISLLLGTGAGAQPLISQAFGAKNYKRCGDLLQRQFGIHAVLVCFIGLAWFFADRILLSFRQPTNIAALAGQFAIWRLPALPAYAMKEDINGFLIAQRVVKLPMLMSTLTSLVNIFCLWLFIPRLGFVGAPLSLTVANYFQCISLLVFVRCVLPEKAAWPIWNLRETLTGWGEILKLALPGGLLMLCEWWGWETNLFLAGLLCDATSTRCLPLEVFPILANTMAVAFVPNYGFAVGAGALIGNALGANEPQRARQLAIAALTLATTIGGILGSLLLICRNEWGWIFSQDEEVVSLTAQAIPALAVYIFLDNLGPGTLNCILRSVKLVAFPAIMTFISFYVVGIPFGALLTFGLKRLDLGVIGLWIGLAVGMFTMVLSLLFFLWCRVNWEVVAEAAHKSSVSSMPLETTSAVTSPAEISEEASEQKYELHSEDCSSSEPSSPTKSSV